MILFMAALPFVRSWRQRRAKMCIRDRSWLLPEAKKEWKRLASSLEAMGVLTMADLTAFAGYCQAYARWKEAEEFILSLIHI